GSIGFGTSFLGSIGFGVSFVASIGFGASDLPLSGLAESPGPALRGSFLTSLGGVGTSPGFTSSFGESAEATVCLGDCGLGQASVTVSASPTSMNTAAAAYHGQREAPASSTFPTAPSR